MPQEQFAIDLEKYCPELVEAELNNHNRISESDIPVN
jgi:hypothetical protein